VNVPFEVVVRSTPQRLATGLTDLLGNVTSSFRMPSNLEPGWHSLTFTSTSSNGTAFEQVLYFSISSAGDLLSSTYVKPAALANTGAASLAVELGIGIATFLGGMIFIAVRRRLRNDG
jgi:hypothetical protein